MVTKTKELKRISEPPVRGKNSLVKYAIEQIRGMILNGNLKIGDALPSEANLAEEFGVSRRTIREALRQMEVLGILTIKPGKGIYIGGDMTWLDYYISVITSIFEINDHVLEELIDLRMLIERFCVPRVIEYATDKDIEELRTMARTIGRQELSFEDRAKADIDFHIRFVELAQNRFMSQIMHLLKRHLIYEFLRTAPREARKAEYLMKAHLDIVKAIESRDIQRTLNEINKYAPAVKRK